jgi:hypothetical protein
VATLRSFRNQLNGFWVAASDPGVARQALTGCIDLDQVNSLMLLSDGASRLVDRFDLYDWAQALALTASSGPQAMIQAVRDSEFSDPHGRRWPRGKIHDDATLAYCDRL